MSKEKNRKQKPVPSVCTDTMAVSIYNNLLSDFRSVHDAFAPDATVVRCGKPESYRDLGLPDYRSTLPARFRAYYQLDSLFKKYRFQDEQLTKAELEELTYAKYNDFQAKRSRYGIIPYRTLLVLQRARRICRDILGEFDWDEVMNNCRFGRKSSVGCNFANAYLDVKFTSAEAYTGSSQSEKFFKRYLLGDALLARLFGKRNMTLAEILPLIIVPKKYNIGRTIEPLTLIGLFLSHGIGVTVEERLALCNKPSYRLNIRKLQQIHRRIIRRYSKTRSHATLDMSFGSENITSWLLNRLLPRKWFNALRLTFSRQIDQNGRKHYTESVLPMGNGATFPVETLIFFSIIRATGELLGAVGRYSAYGDDLIVPSSCYDHVLTVFEDLGIAVNREKSFCQVPFRESCGADFYQGAAVRPFYMPEGMKCDRKTDNRYISWLYKCINGLLARWDAAEIPRTMQCIAMELAIATSGKVLLIPPSFPDGAGVKTADPLKEPFPGYSCWTYPTVGFADGTRYYRFKFLLDVPRKRKALTTACYYWDKLRTGRKTKVTLPHEWLLGKEPVPTEVEDVPTSWKNLVHKDHLRYLNYTSPPTISYTAKEKTFTFTDVSGTVRKRTRITWTPWTVDRRQSRLTVHWAGRDPRSAQNKEEEPIITDWI